MFKKRFLLIAVLLLVITLCLSGCSAILESVEDTQIRKYTQGMLDAIIAKDFDTAYTFVEDAVTKDVFAREYTRMEALLYDVESYELKFIGFSSNTNFQNGKTFKNTNYTYEMAENDDKYIVYVNTNSDYQKLSCFDVKAFESTNLYYTGTINKMGDATAFQWVMLLSNLLTLGIAVFAVIDCAKNKIKLKALWIIIIILGMLTFGVSITSATLRANFSLGLFMNYSSLIKYGDGSLKFSIMLPVGAIVYLILRNTLIKKATTKPQPPQYYNPPQQQYYQPTQPPYQQYNYQTPQYQNPVTPDYQNTPPQPQNPYSPPRNDSNE